MRPGAMQSTPIMIDGVVYISTGYHRVIAIDAETGKQIWAFDPKTYEEGPPVAGTGPHRGVMFWRDGEDVRILINARQQAVCGEREDRAARDVVRDRREHQARREPHARDSARAVPADDSPASSTETWSSSAAGIPDRLQYRSDPPGIDSGLRHPHRQTRVDLLHDSAVGEGLRRRHVGRTSRGRPSATPTSGAPMALDESARSAVRGNEHDERRLLGRPASRRESVCGDARCASTRRPASDVWHFQAVHHGIWDWDFASPPNLLTITVDGKQIDAVAQLSKQGFAYVFDRVDRQAGLADRGAPGRHEVRDPRRAGRIRRSRFPPGRRRWVRRASRSTMPTI